MSFDLYQREADAIHAAETVLSQDDPTAEELKEGLSVLLGEFRKSAKETKRLVRMSDRSEEKIRKAQAQIAAQNEELKAAQKALHVQAEALETSVRMRTRELSLAQEKLSKLVELGIGLSAERDSTRLLELIIVGAKELTNADGGTLYIRTEDDGLKFETMRTDSLNISLGGTTGKPIPLPPVAMRDEDGNPNHRNVASYAALLGQTVNIDDAYENKDFDFTGTRKFDAQTGYRSQSFLTVPLKPRGGDVIGVVQLINARDAATGEVIPFPVEIQGFVEALSSQAAVALDNRNLLEAQEELIESIIRLIAGAIDAKSAYTGGHCERVPEIGAMLAKAACESNEGIFADFDLTEEEWREFRIAAWLHDCGKVTTPEYVVDKATKLETIYNRIHEIRTRFEVLRRDAEIAHLKACLEGAGNEEVLAETLAALDDDFAFLAECNVGGEFMAPDKVERLTEIATRPWVRHFDDRLGLSQEEHLRLEGLPAKELPATELLLSDKPDHIVRRPQGASSYGDNPHGFKMEVPEHLYNYGEIYNLSISRGTLTAEERFKINDHIVQTIVMLNQLPFPKPLRRVPEYAGAHHETMIGTGYPCKLSRDDMPLAGRMLAVADIFEALTASDRPYKKAKTLSEAVRIMGFMRKDQHIDSDLFELFLRAGVHKTYAETYLLPEQLDEVDIEPYLTA